MGMRALTFQTDDGVTEEEGTVLLNEEGLLITSDWFGGVADRDGGGEDDWSF